MGRRELLTTVFYSRSAEVAREREFKKNLDERLSPLVASLKRTQGKIIKVSWVQAFSRMNGGAELSSLGVIKVGEKLGFNIIKITPVTFHRDLILTADVVILNDLIRYPVETQVRILELLREYNVPYVVYDHNAYEGRDSGIYKSSFIGSKLNIFLSPLHSATRRAQFGYSIDPYVDLLLCIDPYHYKPVEGITREKDLCIMLVNSPSALGKMHLESYVKKNPRLRYVFYTMDPRKMEWTEKYSNITLHEPISPDKVPEELSRATYLLHMADAVKANDRVIFEAILCGCKPIMNDMIGAGSWKHVFDINNISLLRQVLIGSPYLFWRHIVETCT